MAPLVTAVMPTRDSRRRYLNDAVAFFEAQTFKNCQLVIVDECQYALIREWPENVRYVAIPDLGISTGEKRNLVNELVDSDIIIHWDDDDWYHPERIQRQVEFFLASGKQVTGYHDLLYWREDDRSFWIYRFNGVRPYATGVSLCYYKSWWEKHPFSKKRVGEDSDFWIESKSEMASQGHLGLIVARAHHDNTYNPVFGQSPFFRANREMFPQEFLTEVGA